MFLKIDADQTRTDVEVEAMALAPIPTPEVLWRKPPVLALAALPGTALGCLGEPSTASRAAWVAAADEITGVIDWSEAGQGDALYDLASLTLGHEEHLGDLGANLVKRAPFQARDLVASARAVPEACTLRQTMGIGELRQIVGQLALSVEALGAVGAALQMRASGRDAPPQIQEALQAAIAAIGGPDLLANVTPAEAGSLLAASRAVLSQSLDAIAHADRASGWAFTDPQVLDDWGTISASLVPLLKQSVVPRLAGLAARLEAPAASFLDVGVGTAQLTIAMCQSWPTLSAVGLDPWAPALAQARSNLARTGLANRVSLQPLPVQELTIEAAFDLAWLATPFIPPSVLETGVTRIARALRPGGWLLLGQFAAPGDLGAALVALRTVRSGGRVLSAAEAERLLTGAGLRSAQTLPSDTWPAGMLVVAQRPPD